VVERKGLLVPVTDLTPPRTAKPIESRDVRFRTVGDITCTCPVESLAATAADIVIETLPADVSERGATRMDDKTSEASDGKAQEGRVLLMTATNTIAAPARSTGAGSQTDTCIRPALHYLRQRG